MNPDTLLKAGLGCLAVGLLLTAFAGRSEPDPPPKAAVATPARATPEPEPEVVEVVEPPPVPTPQVDPAERARLESFRDGVFAAASTTIGPELQAAATELGVEAVARELQTPTEGRATPLERNRVLYSLLAHIGTDDARAVLLADALKPAVEPSTLGPAAAEAWLTGTETVEEALPLLDSKEATVRHATLVALAGRELTPGAVEALGRGLVSGSFDQRTLTARIFALDPSAAAADAKLKALVIAASRAQGFPGSAKVHPESGMTYGEMAYGAFLNAAVTMPGSAEAAAAARSNRLDLVTLVLAAHGDAEVGAQALQMAVRGHGYQRFVALEATAPTLTLDDASLLIKLSGDTWELAPEHPGGRAARFPTSELANSLLMGLQ